MNPPLKSPPSKNGECVDVSSSEKLYISMLEGAREDERDGVGAKAPIVVERKKKKKPRDIYLLKQCYRPRRGSYRTNAVRNRCRQFAQDFHDLGFPIGVKITKRELRYRMVTLDLAHDKITVNQYFERLVMYGYFKILPNGLFEFRSTLPVGQQALPDPKATMHRLNSVLNPLPKQKGSY